MKLGIVLLFIVASTAFAGTPACAPANKCMSCDETNVTRCLSCFNFGLGTVLARFLSAHRCTDRATTITDCKYLSPDLTTAATNISTGCFKCINSDLAVIFNSQKTPDTIHCKELPTGCNAIVDCEQMHCETTDGENYTSKCLLCARGKGAFVAGGVTTQCNSAMMNNCDYMTGLKCYWPSFGYAVDFEGTATVSYTTDSNCKALQQTTRTNCRICWDGYYWDTSMCKLRSGIMAVGLLGAVLPLVSFLW
jgi:hypothetical protein